MQQNMKNRIVWKAITWLFIITGIILLLLTLPTYTDVIQYLGRFSPDGSFDSLSQQVFNGLIFTARIKGGFLILAGLFSIFNEKIICRLLAKLQGFLSRISIKRELKQILSTAFTSGEKWILLTLGIITLIGLLTRLIQFNRSVDYDEAYTFIHFASRSFRTIITDYSAPNNHIFHSLLVHLVYLVFGSHLWALRLPVLIAGVLTIPAAYLAARSFYGRYAGLLAAGLVSLAPMLVDYSINARGYSLMCLFASLLLWLAGVLRQHSSFTGWFLLSITAVLGFYTLPVMVYPVSAVFLWLLLCWFVKDINGTSPRKFITSLILTSLFTISLVILFYSPIFLFGTGLSSITSNEFVQSRSWIDFYQSIQARIPRVWQEWNFRVPGVVTGLTMAGLLFLLLLEWRNFKHKIPLWISSFTAIAVLLIIQRVAPWPRVWLFLLVYVLIWSAAGWAAMWTILLSKFHWRPQASVFLVLLTLAASSGYLALRFNQQYSSVEENITKDIAIYISENITDKDTLVAVSPVPIQVGYYLSTLDIPFDRFYDRARKGNIEHAIVIVADRSKYPTLESVVDFQQLDQILDIDKAELVHQYKRMKVYNVPVFQ